VAQPCPDTGEWRTFRPIGRPIRPLVDRHRHNADDTTSEPTKQPTSTPKPALLIGIFDDAFIGTFRVLSLIL
jgi:hypothetical protein